VELHITGSAGGHAEKDPFRRAPRRVADPARGVREQFLVEVADSSAEQLAEQGLSPAAALLELNALFRVVSAEGVFGCRDVVIG
jgi:hypothetical protein